MTELYSLCSNTLAVEKSEIRGKLAILGNIEKNWMKLIFTFDKSIELSPLIIEISDGNKVYNYLCTPKKEKNCVSSSIFEPEFLMSRQFSVVSIKPLVVMGEIK